MWQVDANRCEYDNGFGDGLVLLQKNIQGVPKSGKHQELAF